MNQQQIDDEQIRRLVHNTLHTATQPSSLRLAQLRPAIPQRPLPRWQVYWQRQLAPVALLIFVLLGVGFHFSQQSGWAISPSPTALSITATTTEKPTATIAQTETTHQTAPQQTIVATIVARPTLNITPVRAAPTPVAALPNQTTSN